MFDVLVVPSLEKIEEYAEFVEKEINEKAKKQEKDLALMDGIDVLDEEEAKEAVEDFKAEILKYTVDFTSIARSSSLIHLYSFAEHQLITFCNYHAKEQTEKFKEKKDGKAVTINARKYLQEVVGMDFSDIEDHWKLLDNIRKIRNYFVHSVGEVEETETSKKKAIEETEGVSIGEYNKIHLEKKLISNLADSIKGILLKVYESTFSYAD